MDTRVQTHPRWRPDQQMPVFDPAHKAISFTEQLFGCTACCAVGDNDVPICINIQQFGLDEIGQDGEDWDELFCRMEDMERTESSPTESEEHYSKLIGNNGLRGMNNTSEGSRQKADIQEELESLAESTGDLFEAQGWDIVQVSDDRFDINGRKVRIFLLPRGTPLKDYSLHSRRFGPPTAQRAAHIMVHDGPLKQPLLDYLMQTGLNEHYDARGTENPVAVTGEARKIEFEVPATALGSAMSEDSRLDAMKHATAQAVVRRKSAADGLNLFPDGLNLFAGARTSAEAIRRGRSPNMNRPIAGSVERSAINPRLGPSRDPSLNRLVAGVPCQYAGSRESTSVGASRESSPHCRMLPVTGSQCSSLRGSSAGSQSPGPPRNRAG